MSSPPSFNDLIACPPTLNLPPTSTLVTDADEEIFLLYTLQNSSSGPTAETGTTRSGLGFVSTSESVKEIELTIRPCTSFSSSTISPPYISSVNKGSSKKSQKGKEAGGEERTLVISLEQDLQALRHRVGDTGSVLWLTTLSLAHYLLTSYYFSTTFHLTPLFPEWNKSRILELGSGTGFLGIALRDTVARWCYSDLLINLALVERNLKRNPRGNGSTLKRVKGMISSVEQDTKEDIREIDWLYESEEYLRQVKEGNSNQEKDKEEEEYDIIIAADCIYNPVISLPLAHTITSFSSPRTIMLVASELRDQEPFELFLEEIIKDWNVVRLGEDPRRGGSGGGEEGEEGGRRGMVIWVGWRKG